MSDWTIYHNPRCSKSREAFTLLKENGITPKVVEYLKDVPTRKELELLVMQLGIPDAVRRTKAHTWILAGQQRGTRYHVGIVDRTGHC